MNGQHATRHPEAVSERHDGNSWPKAVVAGGIAGALATAPMTAVMEGAFRLLPPRQRYPLPPRLITDRVLRRAFPFLPRDEQPSRAVTLAAHFGYGAAAGTLFGGFVGRSLGASMLRGIGYGIAVWFGSYFGLLPAMGLERPGHRNPAERAALMAAAHVVWGGALGAIAHRALGEAQTREERTAR